MVKVELYNDETGTLDKGNYVYRVFLNRDLLSSGRVRQVSRQKSLKEFLEKIASQLPDDLRMNDLKTK